MPFAEEGERHKEQDTVIVPQIDPILETHVETSAQAIPPRTMERLQDRNRALIAAVRNRRKQLHCLETELTYYLTAAEDETRPVLRTVLRRLFHAEHQADENKAMANRLEQRLAEAITERSEAHKDARDFADLLWEMRTVILNASSLDADACQQRVQAFAAYLRGKGDTDAA